MNEIPLPLAGWENFYVIIGSSAAGLTGIMFVVITLVAETGPKKQELATFGTPTVVHFCAAMLVSVVVSAPWPGLSGPRWTLGVAAAAGLVYTLQVTRRAARVTEYRPVLEDWIWHSILPLAAYTAVLLAAVTMSSGARPALFAIAGATILLVFIGIHNAWDTVTFITVERLPGRKRGKPGPR
jgi:hypothetical protein